MNHSIFDDLFPQCIQMISTPLFLVMVQQHLPCVIYFTNLS